MIRVDRYGGSPRGSRSRAHRGGPEDQRNTVWKVRQHCRWPGAGVPDVVRDISAVSIAATPAGALEVELTVAGAHSERGRASCPDPARTPQNCVTRGSARRSDAPLEALRRTRWSWPNRCVDFNPPEQAVHPKLTPRRWLRKFAGLLVTHGEPGTTTLVNRSPIFPARFSTSQECGRSHARASW